MKISKKTVESLTWSPEEQKTQLLFWDDNLKGFGMRITPTGKKSFILQYRIKGREKRLTLGAYPALNPEHARQSALKKLGEVIDGVDPSKVKKAFNTKSITIAELFEQYFEDHVLKNRTLKGQKSIKGDFERVILPAIGRLPAKEITRRDMEPMFEKLRAKPRTHNIIRGYLKTMFTYGIEQELIESSPMAGIAFEKKGKKSRDEWIKEHDFKKLFEQVAKDSNHYVRAYFPLLALTACRKSELQFAKWEDIDFENRIFTIHETKNGSTHEVHLSDPAIEILNGIIRQDGNPFVFCGMNGQAHHDFLKPWQRIRKAVDLEKYTIHDIRRTMATYLNHEDVGSERIGQILNHKDNSVTAIYAKLTHKDKVKTFNKLAEILKKHFGELRLEPQK